MGHVHCQMIFEAGQALIEKSGLANYHGAHFVACGNQAEFNEHWEKVFHPTLGRYMAWVLFSVGAENLAKAVCVCNGVQVSSRATLGAYTKSGGYFQELSRDPGLGDVDLRALQEGYKRLGQVRNRDAHSYHKDVRSANFPLVEEWFVPAFNIAVDAMKRAGHQLSEAS